MNLRTIARALGGQVIGNQVLAPGPAHSRHDRSMAVWIDTNAPDGFRCHSFAGDDWRECRDCVRERLGLLDWQRSASKISAPQPGSVIAAQVADDERVDADPDRIDRAMVLWGQALPPHGTVVERYLQHRRISLPKDVLAADALRFHPSCPFRLDDGSTARLPAMLALMRDITTDELRAIHRTALKEDGNGKADLPGLGNAKKMFGPCRHAVIKLTADPDINDGLALAEGIETALTLLCADWRPIWACGTAGAIECFPVLPGIEALTIFADADRAGLLAAAKCQSRWNEAGLECRILAAPNAGSDWNDIVRAVA